MFLHYNVDKFQLYIEFIIFEIAPMTLNSVLFNDNSTKKGLLFTEDALKLCLMRSEYVCNLFTDLRNKTTPKREIYQILKRTILLPSRYRNFILENIAPINRFFRARCERCGRPADKLNVH